MICGGGVAEAAVSHRLSQWANTLTGMESYCIKAYAEPSRLSRTLSQRTRAFTPSPSSLSSVGDTRLARSTAESTCARATLRTCANAMCGSRFLCRCPRSVWQQRRCKCCSKLMIWWVSHKRGNGSRLPGSEAVEDTFSRWVVQVLAYSLGRGSCFSLIISFSQ